MNDYYFSPSVKLFYPKELAELYELPSDVISVDESVFETFSPCNKPSGKELGCDDECQPCWVNEQPPTPEQSRMWAEWNKQRLITQAEDAITPLERAKRLGMATDDEKKRLTAWETYSVFLSRVDVNDAPDIEWPTVPE